MLMRLERDRYAAKARVAPMRPSNPTLTEFLTLFFSNLLYIYIIRPPSRMREKR